MPEATNVIVDDIVDGEPAVNTDIIDALKAKETAEKPVTNEQVTNGPVYNAPQSAREAFNPAIHERDENGNPRLTKAGAFRRKRGQRKIDNQTNEPVSEPASEQPTNNAQYSEVNYRATAVFLTSLVFTSCQTYFGKAWKPSSDEAENINQQATRFCEANSIADLPPGIALCLAFGMYAAPRLQDEETKVKLREIGESLGFVKPRKVVRNESQTSMGKDNNARSDSGND